MIDKLVTVWVRYCNLVLGDGWVVTQSEAIVGKGAVRPKKPYLTLKIISGPNDYTIDDELIVDSNGFQQIFSQKSFTISIQAFRGRNNDALNLLKTQLSNPDHIDFLRKNGKISVTTRGGVTDISRQLETGFEPRSTMDINFCTRVATPTKVGIIEKVGRVERENGQ